MYGFIDRRPLRLATALVVLAGAALTPACGDGSSHPSTANPTQPPAQAPTALNPGDVAGTVANNHPAPHRAVITAAQLAAGVGLTLDITNGLHSHAVSLAAEQVRQIAAGARVSVMSSTNTHSNGSDPHSHTVTFN